MISMSRRSFMVGLASTFIPTQALAISRSATSAVIDVTVDLGADNGVPLGTILQLRNGSTNQIVGSIGVPQFYNHYVRNNPRLAHAHIRTADQSEFVATEIGTPLNDKPRYHVFVLDGELIDGTNRQVFNETSGAWDDLPDPWHGVTFSSGEQINYAHRLAGGVFISTDAGVYFGGSKIIAHSGQSYASSLGTVLYRDGYIFAEWSDGVLKTYEWNPGGGAPVLVDSHALPASNFLRAFGCAGEHVYAIIGYGKVLRFNGTSWVFVTQTETVNEFYCCMNVFDDLIIGDYQNGNQWKLTAPDSLSRLTGVPPVESGASTSGREIQSMTMFGGDEIATLFPWGSVYRRHIASDTWYHQRVYSAPAIDGSGGPYTTTLGHGDWRQRLPTTGLWKNGIFVGASNTPGNLLAQDYALVSNRLEYGKVWHLVRPNAFSSEIGWKAGQTVFRLEISESALVLKQDGVTLGSTTGAKISDLEGSAPITIETGSGLYGPFAGTIVGVNVSESFA